eukprot:502122-Rhodomonas_salina.2
MLLYVPCTPTPPRYPPLPNDAHQAHSAVYPRSQPLRDFAKAMLGVANPAVKKGAVEVVVALRLQLGEEVRVCCFMRVFLLYE